MLGRVVSVAVDYASISLRIRPHIPQLIVLLPHNSTIPQPFLEVLQSVFHALISQCTCYVLGCRFKGLPKLVNIGYGSDKKTRHRLPGGWYKFVISNVKELEMLLMQNRSYAAEIAHNVSSRKRKEIIERAAQLNVKVLNAGAKLKAEDNE